LSNLFFLQKKQTNFLKLNYLILFLNNDLFFKTSKNLIYCIYKFIKGVCFSIKLEGKRFKFLLNKLFIFFKMDISHFKFLKFDNNFFLKKLKRKKTFFFYTFEDERMNSSLIKIKNFKYPTKYKKKGIFLKEIN